MLLEWPKVIPPKRCP